MFNGDDYKDALKYYYHSDFNISNVIARYDEDDLYIDIELSDGIMLYQYTHTFDMYYLRLRKTSESFLKLMFESDIKTLKDMLRININNHRKGNQHKLIVKYDTTRPKQFNLRLGIDELQLR